MSCEMRKLRAFTLVELVVVVAILALLATLVTSSLSGLLAGRKAANTRATMAVLSAAIEMFAESAGPSLGVDYTDLCPPAPPPGTAPDSYKHLFGLYPPSPTAAFSRPGDPSGSCPPTAENDLNTVGKFAILAEEYLDGVGPPFNEGPSGLPDTEVNYSFSSIECLVLFMRRLCPEAKSALDGLPETVLTNLDKKKDWAVIDRNDNDTPDYPGEDEAIDLLEVTDAWGTPLRYSVKPILAGGFKWELRSAGPTAADEKPYERDQYFAAPWTPEDKSDDIILRGP